MKVLIIGHRGQLGSGRDELPVRIPAAVSDFVDAMRPGLILQRLSPRGPNGRTIRSSTMRG